ncbi:MULTISPECIES: hypothetical protein [unclassified Sphingopyxis]|uniref:hypothetical protein n=1 Tax=unclassified Sphingopyxis TaxID=2614943 RepID=UPI0024AD6A13|nr:MULTISPECIES: hypothetical protein [unclassified Sphingopyxis]
MTVRTGAVFGLAMLATLAGCGEAASSFDESYKKQFLDNFNASCQSSAAGSGAPAATIAEVCKCTGEAILAKHSPAEVLTMKPEDGLPLMKECAAKSGLTM